MQRHYNAAIKALGGSIDTRELGSYTPSGSLLYFTVEPADTITYRNGFSLDCSALGDPSPAITWYRGNPPKLVTDGYVVNGSLVVTTVVEGVEASRGGVPYHCRATNAPHGTIRSRTAIVHYAYFDGFHERGNITYNVNIPQITADRDTVALYCNISGSIPSPSILWVDNFNQTVPSDESKYLYLDGGRYLVIINIDMATAQKVFHCRVNNVLGTDVVDSTTQHIFNTTEPLGSGVIIYKPMGNITAYDGDVNVQFSLVAVGHGPIVMDYAVTHQSPGSSLQGSLPKQSVVVGILAGPVTVNDSGTVVRCSVFSSEGVVQYYSTMTVLARAPLVITSSPADSLYSTVGEQLTFACKASGVNLVIRWYWNGEQVTSLRIEIVGFTMTNYGLMKEDSGMYQCSVTNGTNSVWRQWRVVVREPKLIAMPTNNSVVVVDSGGDALLRVQVMSYPPPNHVLWYMNGSLVMPSDLYILSNISASDASTDPPTYTASLTITSVNLTTQGFYVASFFSIVGVVNISTIFVTPSVPSYVLSFKVPACFNAGEIVQLVCIAYGYPIPVVLFFKDNSSLTSSDHTTIKANTLTIKNILPDDVGVYWCSSDNGQYDQSNSYELQFCSSNATNSSLSTQKTSEVIIISALVGSIVLMVTSIVAVVAVLIWCYHKFYSKQCSVDFCKDDNKPKSLTLCESSVDPPNSCAPIVIYETVRPLQVRHTEDGKSREGSQDPQHHLPILSAHGVNVTYALPDLSKKNKGQDPTTILHVKAPMGDQYTVPDRKLCKARNEMLHNHEKNSNLQAASLLSSSTPSNHHVIAPQTGEAYEIQNKDMNSKTQHRRT